MARKITVNTDSLALPDGGVYDSGDEVVLSDEQYARLSDSMFDDNHVTDGGYQSDIVLTSPDGTAYRIVVDDDGVLSTEEVTP